MKIMWHSTAMFVGAGYGVITRELVHRIKKAGHQIDVFTKHFLGGNIIVEDVDNYDGTQMDLINQVLERDKYDYIITIGDAWVYPGRANYYFTKSKWVSSMFLDVQFIHSNMIQAMDKAAFQLVLTEHGKSEMERIGFQPLYAPLGVDTKLFKPDAILREEFRKKKGWQDKFVFGVVGINYPTDRKNIINTIKTFQAINKKYPDTILYLHTSINGLPTNGLPLEWIIQSCGFPPDGSGAIKYCNQIDYRMWIISQKELVGLYNAFDVLCLPTIGEGFGMPLVESQACGCPVITTDTTSGKELMKSGWLIPVDDEDYEWSTLYTWFAKIRMNKIYEYMEKAYLALKDPTEALAYREKAHNEIQIYDWDYIFDKYWIPLLNTLDEAKRIPPKYPNWSKEIYDGFEGRIYTSQNDCGIYHNCNRPCDKLNLFRFPKEPLTEARSLMLRSYPLFPDKNLKNMLYDSNCPMAKWVGGRFEDEVNIAWDKIIGYPALRRFYRDKWEESYFDRFKMEKFKERKLDFDSDYANIFAKPWETQFEADEEVVDFFKDCQQVLEVGCGKGIIVNRLIEKGIKAKGIDINKSLVNGDMITYGDACNIPYGDKTIDGIITVDTLEHLDDPMKALSEIFRVARKKVLIYVTALDSVPFREDPTHKVKWQEDRWWKEIAEFGKIVKKGVQRFYIEVDR